MRALVVLSCLALLIRSAIADTLDERPVTDDYTNAVVVGTWCGKGIEFRSIVLGDTNVFLPRAASQQALVAALKQKIHAKGELTGSYMDNRQISLHTGGDRVECWHGAIHQAQH
jgi:hypothetical protein